MEREVREPLQRNTSGIMPHCGACIKRAAVNIPVLEKKARKKNIKPMVAVKLEMGDAAIAIASVLEDETEGGKNEDEGAMNGR